MYIFKQSQNKLVPIKELRIDLEKDLQKVVEENLESVLGLKFISSEFSLNNLRIDTLAFDEETRSFVIIEFKKDRNFSVIDQGFAYLALMLNNEADFILEYNQKMNSNLKKDGINWDQSRVLFLSSSFTNYQVSAIDFKDLPIELWEVKKFDEGILSLNQLESQGAKKSIKMLSKNKTIESVSREIRNYTVDDHFKPGWNKSRELFNVIREKILALDDRIQEKVNKYYIGYKIGFYNVCAIHVFKSKLEVHLVRVEKSELRDPEKKVVEIPWRKFAWGKLCSYTVISLQDIDYAMFLVKQVLGKFYK